MSNSLAIAAVTETMRQLIDRCINASPGDDPGTDPELAGTSVTTRPPDKARTSATGNQVNLFLYQTEVNAAWRNQTMPRQVRPGENGYPPLALDLRYILTAYGADDEGAGILAHRLLGRTMSILHDSAAFKRGDIQAALAGNDLYEQIESLRVIPHPMTAEEIARLWAAFQTPYRISASYQVSVVLIESNKPIRASLPVLARGKQDRGPFVNASRPPGLDRVSGLWNLPIEPPPGAGSLTRTVPAPSEQPVARLGERLILRAVGLPEDGVTARFSSARLPDPIELDFQAGDRPGEWQLNLPAPDDLDANGHPARSTWVAGFYTLALVIRDPDPSIPPVLTNEQPVMLAPMVTLNPSNAPAGDVTLTVTCDPRLTYEQSRRTILIFGSRQVPPETVSTPSDPNQPTTLIFKLNVPGDEKGVYTVRLRVDGIDSLPFAAPQSTAQPAALVFDPQQQVTIT